MRDYKRFTSTTPDDIQILFGDINFKDCLFDLIKTCGVKVKKLRKDDPDFTHQICNTCNVNKTIDQYYPHKNLATGFYRICKLCCKIKRREENLLKKAKKDE